MEHQKRWGKERREPTLLSCLAVAAVVAVTLLGGLAQIVDRPVARIDATIPHSTGDARVEKRADAGSDESSGATAGARAPAQRAAREDSTAPFRPRG